MKRGSANMWWIIIGAVIALVVMIILMVMFTSKTTTLEGGLLNCEGKGGECVPKGTGNDMGKTQCGTGTISSAFTCSPDKICCFKEKKFNSS